MRSWRYGIWLTAAMLPPTALAEGARYAVVDVQEAFLDLRALPDRRYPVADIAERGEHVQLIKRRTDWYLLRTEQGQQGWVAEEQMGDSLRSAGIAPSRHALEKKRRAAARNKDPKSE
jgi:SH3-like domain-containing protein